MKSHATSLLLAFTLFAPSLCAQPAPGDKPVTMDFPADGIEVKTLADIVTKRLKIPILYDESINNKKVIIRVPVDVPENALLGVLQSALRMKQLALADAEHPGWKQIVPATNLAAIAKPPDQAQGGPVVQVFNLKQADTARIVEAVRPFLTPNGGSIQPVPGQKTVIVADYASVVSKAQQVIATLDEGTANEVKFVPIKNADPTQVATTLTQILATKEGSGQAATGISISPDDRSGQVIVVAPKSRIAEIEGLVAAIDKPLELDTKVYRLKTLAPDRIDRLVKTLVGPSVAKRAYQSSVDKESASLVVSATADIHKRIESLVKELDQPVAEGQSPIRFYRLKNTKAADVLATLSSLMGDQATIARPAGGDGENGAGRSLLGPPASSTDNRIPLRPANYQNLGASDTTIAPGSPMARPRADDLGPMASMNPRGAAAHKEGATTEEGGEENGEKRSKLATVTADVNTNSIIVIAPPATQTMYEKLINELDRRRPQVQIECTIVTLDTSDNFTLGVDIAKAGGFDNSKIIGFSSFGVGKIDPTTGVIVPIGNSGGTLAVLSPSIANIVIRALQTNSRARLVSAPQLLVNDNGKGKLESVSQEPFAEILDTSTTQSRTGLGGLAQAGTTISVEPHISEDDYLQLAYSIELSNFTGVGRNGLPPPSQKNSVDSTVTVPDGSTIVVGGLRVKNFRESRETIPFVDLIPFGDWIFGTHSNGGTDTTLFVFIKPVILRDDKFEDLKYLSEKALNSANLPGQYPRSSPVPIK